MADSSLRGGYHGCRGYDVRRGGTYNEKVMLFGQSGIDSALIKLLNYPSKAPIIHRNASSPGTESFNRIIIAIRAGPIRRSARSQRSPYKKQMLLAADTFTTTPLQNLQGTITTSNLYFERHHNGVPAIDLVRRLLLMHGLMDRLMMFTVEELKRFLSVSRFAFIRTFGQRLR